MRCAVNSFGDLTVTILTKATMITVEFIHAHMNLNAHTYIKYIHILSVTCVQS